MTLDARAVDMRHAGRSDASGMPVTSATDLPKATDRPSGGNTLLLSLSAMEWSHLQPHLEVVELTPGVTLYGIGDPARCVLFPDRGVLSLSTPLMSGREFETCLEGREGGVGVVEALGGGVMHSRVVVQAPGQAHRVSADRFRRTFAASEGLRAAVHRRIELLLAEGRQAAACHSLHPIAARFSRRLLEYADLAGTADGLPLKQSVLAAMLGVQRTTVSAVAAQAQRAGLIHYRRGRVWLADRPGLERSACECRATLQAHRRRLEVGAWHAR